MTPPLDSNLLRILNAAGKPVGVGFLVAERRALTCVHVIQTAAPGAANASTAEVTLDFPLLADHPRLTARVAQWDETADIAVLELEGELPPEARPVRLVKATDLWGHAFRAFGFPTGVDNGGWASGRILARDANGWLQVEDTKTTGYAVQAGYSGGPLWDEQVGGVVGMVVVANNRPGVRAAYGLTVELLLASFPALKAATPGVLHNVPELPPHYLPRSADLAPLKAALLAPENTRVGLTGKALKAGVQGMGGVGKSVLAAALAHNEEIGRAFPDGVIWLTLGQQPNLTARQAQLAAALGELGQAFADAQQGRATLERLLAPAACLVVLDDVWELEHAEAFNVLGPTGRILLTTRNAEVVRALGASLFSLDVLDEPQALALLAEWADAPPNELPSVARYVAQECGCLPLALAMVGALVRRNPKSWEQALRRLRSADLEKIKRDFPDYPYPDLMRAIQVSVEALPEDERQRYLELAVLPEDTPIPPATLGVYWDMDADDVADLCKMLEDRALARRDAHGRLTLHDLQHDFVHAQMRAALSGLHNCLLNAYHTRNWADLPEEEPYLWDWLAYHLLAAERGAELVQTVQDLRYLVAKTQARNPFAADADLKAAAAFAPNDAVLGLLRRQFGNLTHLLRRCEAPKNIGATLQARLSQCPQLAEACRRFEPHVSRPYITARLPLPDAPHPALIRTLAGHTGGVHACAYSPDGRWIVSASDDCTLKVWDAETGAERLTLTGHTNIVWACTYSPDGRWIVSASFDKTLKVWDAETGVERLTLTGHTEWVYGCAFSPDGRRIVSASSDRTLKVWDAETGAEHLTLAGHPYRVRSCAFSPDGRRIVSASSDRTLKVWDAETGAECLTLTGHTDLVSGCAYSPDGRQIVSASGDDTLKVWDAETGVERLTLSGHVSYVTACAYSPDGRRIVSASFDHTLKVWDAETGVELLTLRGHTKGVNACAYSPEGRRIVSASDDRTLKVWDVETGKERLTLTGHTDVVKACAYSSDGRRIVSASRDKKLRVWDAETGAKRLTLKGHTDGVLACAYSPDGRRIVSASSDKKLRVWDAETGAKRLTLKGHTDGVLACAYSPDGRQIVSASLDGTLKVWNAETGAERLTLTGHTYFVTACAYSPDGQRIVSASEDGALKVWSVDTGACLATFYTNAWLDSCAIAPNGKDIVTVERMGAIYWLRWVE